MSETTTDNAPSETGVENEGNLTGEEMMGMFLRESEEAPAEVSEESDPDAEEQATTAQEEEEPDSNEAESEEEEPDEGEPDEDDVLSELKPNAAKRARKRIDKLTARTKEAEERLQQREQEFQQLQQRLETLEKGGQEQERQQMRFVDRAESAEDPAELQEIYQTAIATRDWVDDHIDEESTELNGQEVDRETMKAMRKEAREIIEKVIPQRAQYLQQRQQFEQSAVKDFPAWKDTDHPDHKLLQEIWNDPVAQETFKKMPNGRYLASVFAEGLKVIRNKGKKETQEKEEPKPKKKQAVAPKVPGVDDNYAPSETASDSDYERAFQEKTSLSQEDLVAYFARKERAKRK